MSMLTREHGDPEIERLRKRGMPPGAFPRKRLQATENKGCRLQKERQEILRGRKRLRGRELGSGLGRGPIKFVRDGRRSNVESEEARAYTWGCREKEGQDGDTVSRTLIWRLPRPLLFVK